MRLTKISSILIAVLSFALLFAFQNCAPVGSTSKLDTASTAGDDLAGNGGNSQPPVEQPPAEEEEEIIEEEEEEEEEEDNNNNNNNPPDDFTGCDETNDPRLDDNDRPVLLGWSSVSAGNNSFSGYSTSTANRDITIGMGSRSGDSNDIRIYLGVDRGNDPNVQNHAIRCNMVQMRAVGNGNFLDTSCNDEFTGENEFSDGGDGFDEVMFEVSGGQNVICAAGSASITISIQDQCTRNNRSNRQIVLNVTARDGCLPEGKVVQPNIQFANNNMGKDVAISGLWVASTAPEDDEADAGGNSGAVVVYKRSGNNAVNVVSNDTQKLLPTGSGLASARLQSVAMDGDYLIAGAPTADIAAGAAWLYKKDNNDVWQFVTRINPPASAVGQYTLFGWDVAIEGSTFVVSAIRDGAGGTFAGAAYVYTIGNNDSVSATPTKLTASDASDRAYFGYSLAMDGGRIAVGAPVAADSPNSGSGQVYLYSSGSYSETIVFPSNQAPTGSQLGYSVDLEGNLLIAGAPRDDGARYDENSPTGAAFLANVNNLNNISISEFNGSDGRFGEAVAIDANRAVITALDFENGRGTASIFNNVSGGNRTNYFELQARDQRNQDEFGISVAVDGNMAVVGAWLDTINQNSSNWDKAGSAYIVNLNP